MTFKVLGDRFLPREMKQKTEYNSRRCTDGPDGREVLRTLGVTLYSFVFLGC